MNYKKIEQNILTVVFLIFVSFFIYSSLNYSYLDRRMVLFFGLPSFILLVFLLLADNIPRLSGLHIKARFFNQSGKKDAKDKDQQTDPAKRSETKRIWSVFLSLFAFFVLIVLLGFLPAIPIFTLFYLRFFSQESWLLSILLSACLWAMVYFGFVLLLGVQF